MDTQKLTEAVLGLRLSGSLGPYELGVNDAAEDVLRLIEAHEADRAPSGDCRGSADEKWLRAMLFSAGEQWEDTLTPKQLDNVINAIRPYLTPKPVERKAEWITGDSIVGEKSVGENFGAPVEAQRIDTSDVLKQMFEECGVKVNFVDCTPAPAMGKEEERQLWLKVRSFLDKWISVLVPRAEATDELMQLIRPYLRHPITPRQEPNAEMVERFAQRIGLAYHSFTVTWEEICEENKQHWRNVARDSISALQEPKP